MHAHPGDIIIVRGPDPDDPERECQVLDVRGPCGDPPYQVRWLDDGTIDFCHPAYGRVVHHSGSGSICNTRHCWPATTTKPA
jgi:hypothetical protein